MGPGGDLLLPIRVAPRVGDEVAAKVFLPGAGEVHGERHVHGPVVRARAAQRDIGQDVVSARLTDADAPALLDRARVGAIEFPEALGWAPFGKRGVDQTRAAPGFAGQPAVRPELGVQVAQAAQVVVVATAGARQPLGRLVPVERDVGPEELEEGSGLLADAVALGEGLR